MRKEPFFVNDIVHVYNRGNRKQLIVHDAKDRWHFLQMLYYFNTEKTPDNPFRNLRELLKSDFNSRLLWPKEWGTRQPIVLILAFALMKNHFHLLLQEIKEGGTSLFMQRLGTGMTSYSNLKYQEVGRLFHGSYKAKRVDKDNYLRSLDVYIQVKNPFELYSGGLKKAVQEFDKAFDWATQYPYCSLGDYMGHRNSQIVDTDFLKAQFSSPKEYKEFARERLLHADLDEELDVLAFD